MKIIVGYRPTPEGAAALNYALQQHSRSNAPLLILHSSEPLDEATQPSLEQQIDALSTQLTTAGIQHDIRSIDPHADPAEAILDAQAQTEGELIVIGVRRRSPVGKLILGSTAQRVILEADCAVVAVKA